MREVEAKYRVVDAEALLLALKARGVELSPAGGAGRSGVRPGVLAVRAVEDRSTVRPPAHEAGRHLFTVKVPGDNELSCEEHDTIVADREQMHGAVVAMGFPPTVRIVKTHRGQWGEVLCLDDVAGLGVFLESERLVPPEVPGLAAQAELADLVATWGSMSSGLTRPMTRCCGLRGLARPQNRVSFGGDGGRVGDWQGRRWRQGEPHREGGVVRTASQAAGGGRSRSR